MMVKSGAMIDLNRAEKVAIKAAHLGREILLDYFGQLTNVSEKNQAGLVSEADVASEKAIIEFLKSEFPDIGVFGEESSFQNPGYRPDEATRRKGLWLIDPLDGTTNYVHKFPIYCVSIGLEYQGNLVVAACDVPIFKKTYTAVRGKGAYANGEKLSVSSRSKITESLLATGFSSYDTSREQLEIFASLVTESRGLRRAGSAAYDLCLVAEGIFDGYWEKNLFPWDTAAGALLVREAGGVVTEFDSDTYTPFDKTLVCGNPVIHKFLKNRIREIRAK
jgi:myo-inositol-1(or 4)-monophosphatase